MAMPRTPDTLDERIETNLSRLARLKGVAQIAGRSSIETELDALLTDLERTGGDRRLLDRGRRQLRMTAADRERYFKGRAAEKLKISPRGGRAVIADSTGKYGHLLRTGRQARVA